MTENGHGFQSLGASLKTFIGALERHPKRDLIMAAAAAAMRGEKLADEGRAPICRRCRDHGWMRRDGLPGDPGFGEIVVCDCYVGHQVREQKRRRIFSDALVPPKMEDYSLDGFARLGEPQAGAAARLRAWQATSRWLVLTGPRGVGKTGAAVSLLLEHVRAGGSGLYVVLPTFLERIRRTYDDHQSEAGEAQVLDTAISAGFLVLDDVGTVKLTPWGQEKLFTLINERDLHHREGDPRRTVVTSNLPVRSADRGRETLPRHLGEEDRTWDRIRGWADVIEIGGESRRGQTELGL